MAIFFMAYMNDLVVKIYLDIIARLLPLFAVLFAWVFKTGTSRKSFRGIIGVSIYIPYAGRFLERRLEFVSKNNNKKISMRRDLFNQIPK